MRIAVFSDTHGAFAGLGEMKRRLGPVDWLLHAGDSYGDARRIAFTLGVEPARVRAVVGNCDGGAVGPEEEILTLDGLRLLLTHGHLYDVKRGPGHLVARARQLGVHVAVFGHTHEAVSFTRGGILFFNPGSLTFPRLGLAGSCGLLEVDGGGVRAQHLWRQPPARQGAPGEAPEG